MLDYNQTDLHSPPDQQEDDPASGNEENSSVPDETIIEFVVSDSELTNDQMVSIISQIGQNGIDNICTESDENSENSSFNIPQ